LFSTVFEPNVFMRTGEQAKQAERPPGSFKEFWDEFDSPITLEAAKALVAGWNAAVHRTRLGPNHVVLRAAGPGNVASPEG
jgi:hypothetical protein